MRFDPSEFQDLQQFFEARLELLPSLSTQPFEDDGTQRISKQEAKRRRDALKREAYRKAFKPATPTRNPLLTAEHEASTLEEIDDEGIADGGANAERAVLEQRLRDKISGLREETGVSKIKKKSLQQKNAARQARKDKRHRRKKALMKHRLEKGHKELPATSDAVPQSIAFTDVKENVIKTPSRPRKRKLAEKFRKLSLAQEQQESVVQFTQTGQGGEKVLQKEWDHALERASGKKVLDNPKRLQKSIDDVFKQKAKRAKKWDARRHQEATEKQERQEKRKRNLQRRTEQRKKRKELNKAKKRP